MDWLTCDAFTKHSENELATDEKRLHLSGFKRSGGWSQPN